MKLLLCKCIMLCNLSFIVALDEYSIRIIQ